MTYAQDTLFDTKELTDPRIMIPEMLGKEKGKFYNEPRSVLVFPKASPQTIFMPGEQESGHCTSEGYAEGSDFEGDFTHWSAETYPRQQYEGYLVGFPSIVDEEDHVLHSIHLWGNNSDVLMDTYAIPLLAVSGLFVYSKLYSELQIDLDELAIGGGSRFEIPILRVKAKDNSGESFYRDAKTADIERIVKEIDEAPARVYSDNTKTPSKYRMQSSEQIRHLLD